MEYERTESGLFAGKFHGKIVRAGSVIDEFDAKNLVVSQGLDTLLGIMFTGLTQINGWYLGIYSGNYTPTSMDTALTFPASATESSAYTSATRPAFVAVETNQGVSNTAAPAVFTLNAGATLFGAFLTSSQTKGGTGGVLFSAALFGSSKVMASADQLLLTYSFAGSSM